MLNNLLDQLATLILEAEDLKKEMAKLKTQEDRLNDIIGEVKTALIQAMPTDTYSTEQFTLAKKKDFEMEIKADDLPESFKKTMPDRAKIREALFFGMDILGVNATPITTLIVRKKK